MPRVGAQVVKLFGVLGRDDESELVSVAFAALLERFEVGIVGCWPVGMTWPALAIDAFALDVAQVRGGRTRPGLRQIDEPRLDRDAPRVRAQPATGETRRNVAASQPGTGPVADLAGRFAELAPALLVWRSTLLMKASPRCFGAPGRTRKRSLSF